MYNHNLREFDALANVYVIGEDVFDLVVMVCTTGLFLIIREGGRVEMFKSIF